MSIILQTMITNKLKQSRKLPYVGKKGIHVPGEKAVIVEGAYPASCRSPQQRTCMEREYENGLIDISIVTDLHTMKPIAKAGSVAIPEAIAAADEAAKADMGKQAATPNVVAPGTGVPVLTEPAKGAVSSKVGDDNGAFATGSIKENSAAATPIGEEQTVPTQMTDKPVDMFGNASAVEVKAEEGKIAAEDAPELTAVDGTGKAIVEAPKEEAPKEEAPKEEAPKEEAPKAPAKTAPKSAPAGKRTASRRKPGTKK